MDDTFIPLTFAEACDDIVNVIKRRIQTENLTVKIERTEHLLAFIVDGSMLTIIFYPPLQNDSNDRFIYHGDFYPRMHHTSLPKSVGEIGCTVAYWLNTRPIAGEVDAEKCWAIRHRRKVEADFRHAVEELKSCA